MLRRFAVAILAAQDANGVWFQIAGKPAAKGNYAQARPLSGPKARPDTSLGEAPGPDPMLRRFAVAILAAQDANGVWFQIAGKPAAKGNYAQARPLSGPKARLIPAWGEAPGPDPRPSEG